MSTAPEAEQLVRLSLNGVEVALKITGKAAMHIAAFLYTTLKDSNKTKGKTRLESLVRSGKELNIFSVKEENLKLFTQEAKQYGILYCVVKSKNSQDGLVDIIAKKDDSFKLNRIVERCNLATITPELKKEVNVNKENSPQDTKEKADQLFDDLFGEKLPKLKAEESLLNSISKTPKDDMIKNLLKSKGREKER